MKIKILEKIVTTSQDDEEFDTVVTDVPKAPESANVSSLLSVAVPELRQSHIQSITNDVPRPLESTVPVPMPMIDNSGTNSSPSPQFKQAQKKKRKRRNW